MEKESFASFFPVFRFVLFFVFSSTRPLAFGRAERNAATRRVILLGGEGEKKNSRFEEAEGEFRFYRSSTSFR